MIYESAGVSKELFSATTDAGLDFSIKNDLSMMMILGNRFAHFFTALLNYKFANKRMKFILSILPLSFYNSEEYTSKAKDMAAFGYSFLLPIMSTGLNQMTLADLKELENEVLNFDEILKPLQSAYTQSGKTNAMTAATTKAANAAEKETAKKEGEKKEDSTTPKEQTGDNKENKTEVKKE